VWTDLPPDFYAFRKSFSVEAAVAYVEGLDAHGKTMAREYFKQAPDFVQTPLRRALLGFLETDEHSAVNALPEKRNRADEC
jgi:hypothetical protein